MRRKQVSQQQSPARTWVVEEETQPLPALTGLTFRAFLTRHNLSILDVALAAGLRLLVVWNIERDRPVSRQHAKRVCAGLYRLTGVQYRGRIALLEESVKQGAQTNGEWKQPGWPGKARSL